jgi:hypothetical protein
MIVTLEGEDAGVEWVEREVAMVIGEAGSEALWRLM